MCFMHRETTDGTFSTKRMEHDANLLWNIGRKANFRQRLTLNYNVNISQTTLPLSVFAISPQCCNSHPPSKPRPTPRSPSRLAYALLLALFILFGNSRTDAAWMWTKICSTDLFLFDFLNFRLGVFLVLFKNDTPNECFRTNRWRRRMDLLTWTTLKPVLKGQWSFFLLLFIFPDNCWEHAVDAEEQSFSFRRSARIKKKKRKKELTLNFLFEVFEWTFFFAVCLLLLM